MSIAVGRRLVPEERLSRSPPTSTRPARHPRQFAKSPGKASPSRPGNARPPALPSGRRAKCRPVHPNLTLPENAHYSIDFAYSESSKSISGVEFGFSGLAAGPCRAGCCGIQANSDCLPQGFGAEALPRAPSESGLHHDDTTGTTLGKGKGGDRFNALVWSSCSSCRRAGQGSRPCVGVPALAAHPRTLRIARQKSGKSSGLRLDTKCRSTTTGSSFQIAPALIRSSLIPGEPVTRTPR
jgi:hypothetical protein